MAQVEVQFDGETATWRSGQVYSPNASGTQNWNYTWRLPSEDCAAHTVRARATDTAGNVTVSGWGTVTVDNVPPAVDVTQMLTEVLKQDPSNPVVLQGAASDGCNVSNLEIIVYAPDGTSYRETVQWNGSNWQYAPDLDNMVVGNNKLRVKATDGAGNVTRKGPFDLLIKDNNAPAANDDTATTDEDTAVTIDVLANDSDPDGHTLTVESVTQPANGTATNNGTDVTYMPKADYCGEDPFTYTADDGYGGTDTATVTVTVTCVNAPPVAVDDSATVAEGGTVTVLDSAETSVLDNDSDPEGNSLTVTTTPVSGPGHGSLTLNADGTFSYTHDGSETTSDSFTYEVCDDGSPSQCAMATVNISVTPVNDPPVAVDDSATVAEGGTVTVLDSAETGVLANDSDPEGNSLTVSTTPVSGPSHGNLTLNADGTFSYTHDGSETTSDSFTYEVCDDGSPSQCATATVNISVTPVNDPPVANDDSANVNEDGAIIIHVLFNDTDVDGDSLSVLSVTQPSHGAATSNGTVVAYTPTGDYCGGDTFTYTVSDSRGGTDTATVSITVTCVNDAPVANDDTASTDEHTPVTVDVLANDTDADSNTLTVTQVSDPANGTATINPDGTITYEPDLDFCRQDSFTYTISDGNGGTDTATVSVTVECGNDAPVVGEITAPVDPVQVNTGITASADFTDTNTADTHTAVWDWGDDTTSPGTVTEANGSGSVTDSHTYTTPGVYTVRLTVTDDYGASGESVFRYVVVYDPEGGFVTGGGWIWSTEGAYAADPSLTGKANFGFVSKYKKGASVPTGQTQFQFKAGNLNFHSDTYEWMVVAGANAKYKGVGTINGSGSYRFMITATDGDLLGNGVADGFRIKIWDDSGVVYDNKMGESDGSNATTELGGGSIVIHKSK